MDIPENFIKVRYGEKECGWVEKTDAGKYLVANIPIFEHGINLQDEVSLNENDAAIDGVIKMKYTSRSIFQYDEIADYKMIAEIEPENIAFEGIYAPRVIDGVAKRGLAVMASNLTEKQVKKILKKHGAKLVYHIERTSD